MKGHGLYLGGVGLVKGRVKNAGQTMIKIGEKYRALDSFLSLINQLPFDTIGLILRFGTKYSEPEIIRFSRKHSELETAIEAPLADLREMTEPELRIAFEVMLLKVLVAVAEKYKVDGSEWQRRLDELT